LWSGFGVPATTGSLWYAHTYDPARWALGPAVKPLPDPSVIPEFFGDTILVNGTVSPYVELPQGQYRLRLLNACNARFLNPRLVYAQSNVAPGNTEPNPNAQGPGFVQFGTEGGFLPAPANVNGKKQLQLLLAPAERADLIVDLRAVPAGSYLILYNDAPAPFPKGDARNDYYPGNPKTPTSVAGKTPNTRSLLQIRVTAGNPLQTAITIPASMTGGIEPLIVTQTLGIPLVPVANATGGGTVGGVTVNKIRQLTLNEAFDASGRLIQYLGTNVATVGGKNPIFGREYTENVTEVVAKDTIEVWEIANLTADVHPIHFHLVNVQVLSRQPFSVKTYAGVPNFTGPAVAPDPNEMGWKETVRMNPGEVTRVIMKFTLPAVPFSVPTTPRTSATPASVVNPTLGNPFAGTTGFTKAHEYVWHCHILEHEEHDMMRPLVVLEP
jgi:spore coat protein A, manganese oxidase